VVPDQLVVVGQHRLRQERQEAVGQDWADQQDGFPRSDHLVFQLYAVDAYGLHGAPPRLGFVALFLVGVRNTVTAVTPTVTLASDG
jgi:hypothetical protein